MKASVFLSLLETAISIQGDKELVLRDPDTDWYLDVDLQDKFSGAFVIVSPEGYSKIIPDEDVEGLNHD